MEGEGRGHLRKEEVVERSMKERLFQAEEEACLKAQNPASSYPVWVRVRQLERLEHEVQIKKEFRFYSAGTSEPSREGW